MTVNELQARLAELPDAEFWLAWRALGVAVKAAVAVPPPAEPLIRVGDFCKLPPEPPR